MSIASPATGGHPRTADAPACSSARADLAVGVHVDVDWSRQELFFRRELAKVVGRFSNSTENLREVFHLLSEILGLNRGRLFLVDPATGMLTLRCAYGLTREEMARGILTRGEGITGKVFESGQLNIVQDIDSEPRYLWRTVPRSALPNGTTSMFFFPIHVDGQTRGVFNVNRFRGISRSLTADLEILREVTSQIAQLLRLDDLIAERVQTRTAALEHENRTLKQALDRDAHRYGIIGGSAKIRTALRQIEQVAPSDATVLLLGESGTGKERFAHAVHLASPRRDLPFVKLNCGAVPEALFESELFGHEKGAFTGATHARVGRFEEAHGGTLFLDEIGDLPLNMQVKLLRTLQERTVSRIGAQREQHVDVRIVAATNQDLRQRVNEGNFRLDLFYRLYVVPIHLAPLRERPEDIAPLVQHFLHEANTRFQRNVYLSGEALAALIRYPWPGNVRQVQNVVDRLVLLSEFPLVDAPAVLSVLEAEAGAPAAVVDATGAADAVPVPLPRHIGREQRDGIMLALARTGGVKSRAAQQLGLTLSQLNYRIRVLGIDPADAARPAFAHREPAGRPGS
ncbi:sigma-54-dependent Fis family transcriptional regulator [Burkholderia sp. WAC0059]|uniref:sigma-54 interaction domain-containing protein n=1 Tax=Burkholderia sp. WAC0059 TaxID=2066022 RepID=UPI000C7EBE27|nr:sigma 54-interacting transcriptional regulator [Burkholderia sp. WAC0059]PLZ00619.1 sigma-54-dependent Fis family transcriptional regulator [Burkholderia sp. WAC0059]